jgi:DNA-binding NtrC family response regulator
MPELLLQNGDVDVLRAPLHGQGVTIGKSTANDISVPDDSLPAFLCSLEPHGDGKYRLVDRCGQGVLLNGATVDDDADLKDGDVLTLGRLRARFVARGLDERGPQGPSELRQSTGVLRTRSDGKLVLTDVRVRLPKQAGGNVVALPPAGMRIGALPDNDVVLTDSFVSSFHAQLFMRGERLFVRDLDSTNGTFVNDVRVVEAEVPLGGTVRIGKLELQIEHRDEVADAPSSKESKGPWSCAGLHTNDKKFADVFALIEKVAPHDASVCIFGETGTGKELVAHALHQLSGRKRGPMVPLNCAAFPADLIESELFGHEKGAFTGADRLRKGAFEEADKGTLFLDEIGELPLDAQAKLLRTLETRAVRRVGGRQEVPVDVRIVCATHRDLVEHVKSGQFREDLLHRLYVIPIRLPALRERVTDIVHLARHFAKLLSPTKTAVLTKDAEQKLMGHRFAGNVRELRNIVQRALIMGDGKTIDADDLQFVPVSLAEQTTGAQVFRPGMTMEEIERNALRIAMENFGNMAEAARALGIPKTTFWRRAQALGIVDRVEPTKRDAKV